MKAKVLLAIAVVVLTLFIVNFQPITASPAADCEAMASDAIPNLTSLDFSFNCGAPAPVYFGVCDSGGVPNDDLFNIQYNGVVVTSNFYLGGAEFFVLGSAQSSAGANSATLHSTNNTPFPPATYSYAVSADPGVVTDYLVAFCGADFQGPGMPAGAACYRNVPVFTTDKAPSDGTLEFRIMLGNEDSREVSGLIKTWDIRAGQQLNNDLVNQVLGPRYVRLYWQADGQDDWTMLTSQYWHNEGTKNDEYGVDCRYPAQPSYHTSFASAVPVEDVCFDLLNGCK